MLHISRTPFGNKTSGRLLLEHLSFLEYSIWENGFLLPTNMITATTKSSQITQPKKPPGKSYLCIARFFFSTHAVWELLASLQYAYSTVLNHKTKWRVGTQLDGERRFFLIILKLGVARGQNKMRFWNFGKLAWNGKGREAEQSIFCAECKSRKFYFPNLEFYFLCVYIVFLELMFTTLLKIALY